MAANSILKLKVDNTEYDANIKKAAEGIQHLAKRMHDAQGDFEGLDKASLDFIKDLQYMTTASKTASGQYRELENAYKNLAATYEGLNAFEKEGDAGKALAEQLEILKKRTLDMKANMDAASQSLQTNETAGQEDSSALSKLADKFVVNVDALKLFNWGLQAADGALKVAKDAFFASEATVDEWGRVVDSSKSLYEGFLTALNTGDISGYLSRIDEIVSAARTAYNELDRLGTMKTIQAPKVSAQQTENERIRSMIQTGRYIAPIDGRRNSVFNGREMQNGDKLTAGQIRALEKQLQNGMQNVVKLVGNEVKQTGKAIDAVYERQAKELGISLKEFRKGTSSMEEFDKRMAGYDKYQQWREQHTTIDQQSGREIVARGNPYAEYGKWGTFRVDGDRYNQLVQLIQQRDQQAAQAYGMQSQAYRTMNRAEGFTVSKLMGNSGKGVSGSTKQDIQFADDSIMAQEKLVQELTQKWKTASAAVKDDYKKQLDAAQSTLDTMMGKTAKAAAQPQMVAGLSGFNEQTISAWTSMMKSEISKTDFGGDLYNSLTQNLSDMSTLTTAVQDAMKLGLKIPQEDVQEMFEAIFDRGTLPEDLYAGMIQKFIDEFKERTGKDLQVGENGSLNVGTDKGKDKKQDSSAKQLEKFNGEFSKVTGGVSSILSGVQSMGVEIPKEIGNVIGAISGVSSILSGITALLTLIQLDTKATAAASITDAIIPFASGGIVHAAGGFSVPGNSFSGDLVPAMLNSGELVLNRAQQGNLASQLEGGLMQNLNIDWVLTGDKLRAVLNNNGRRTGRGELVQRNRI